jgi:hypothetical protein
MGRRMYTPRSFHRPSHTSSPPHTGHMPTHTQRPRHTGPSQTHEPAAAIHPLGVPSGHPLRGKVEVVGAGLNADGQPLGLGSHKLGYEVSV